MTTRRASCSCGRLSLTTEGDPVRVSMRHFIAAVFAVHGFAHLIGLADVGQSGGY